VLLAFLYILFFGLVASSSTGKTDDASPLQEHPPGEEVCKALLSVAVYEHASVHIKPKCELKNGGDSSKLSRASKCQPALLGLESEYLKRQESTTENLCLNAPYRISFERHQRRARSSPRG
jgi:hypothetical protein